MFCFYSEDFAASVVVEYVFVGEVESSNSLMLSNLLSEVVVVSCVRCLVAVLECVEEDVILRCFMQ